MVQAYYEEILKDKSKLIEKNKHDRFVIQSIEENARSQAIIAVGRYNQSNSIRCMLEQEEIKTVVELFSNKYDLNDPRVYMVVQSLINLKLSAIRMQKHANVNGISYEVFDAEGNRRIELSPVEEAKRKYDETVIKSVQILNNIIDGEKIQTNHTISFDEIFSMKNKDLNINEDKVIEVDEIN